MVYHVGRVTWLTWFRSILSLFFGRQLPPPQPEVATPGDSCALKTNLIINRWIMNPNAQVNMRIHFRQLSTVILSDGHCLTERVFRSCAGNKFPCVPLIPEVATTAAAATEASENVSLVATSGWLGPGRDSLSLWLTMVNSNSISKTTIWGIVSAKISSFIIKCNNVPKNGAR